MSLNFFSVTIGTNIKRYREFEIAPTGDWVDLAIDLDNDTYDANWNSGWQRQGRIDEKNHVWYAAARVPLHSVSEQTSQAGTKWRVNLYRIDGLGADPDASLHVLAADLRRQSRSQSRARTFWNSDFHESKNSPRERRTHVFRTRIKPPQIYENAGRLAAAGANRRAGPVCKVRCRDWPGPEENVYSRLGVKTVINCRGTWTYLSGSLQFPEVRVGASRSRAPFREHGRAASRRRAADWPN